MNHKRIIFVPYIILALIIVITFLISYIQNNGIFMYALDDVYIHLETAKNFSQLGVWGVNSNEFSSVSSSPLWTFLLSLVFKVTGVITIVPFLLNVIGAVVFLMLVSKCTKPDINNLFLFTLFILILLLFIPLPALIFSGQEHIFQAIIVFGFVYCASHEMSLSEKQKRLPYKRCLLLLSPFLVTIRYEGVFVLLVVFFLYLMRKRFLFAFTIALLSLLLPMIYGLISLNNGWHWLPNPILIKGNLTRIFSPVDFYNIVSDTFLYQQIKLIRAPHLSLLIIISIPMFIKGLVKGWGLWNDKQLMLLMFTAVSLLHTRFAHHGWFYRYEAYLVALGLCVIIPPFTHYFDSLTQQLKALKLPVTLKTVFIWMLPFCIPFFSFVLLSFDLQPHWQSWRGWPLWYESKTVIALGLTGLIFIFYGMFKSEKQNTDSLGVAMAHNILMVYLFLAFLVIYMIYARINILSPFLYYRHELYILTVGFLVGIWMVYDRLVLERKESETKGVHINSGIVALWMFSLLSLLSLVLRYNINRSTISSLYRWSLFALALSVLVILILSKYYKFLVNARFRISELFWRPVIIVCIVVPVLALLFLFDRSVMSIIETPQAMRDRYLEHYLPAEFIRQYYNDETVLLNDIGMAAYYSDAYILDLYGLGSLKPLKYRMQEQGYTAADLYMWCKEEGAVFSILQIEWGQVVRRIPEQWTKVGEWEVPRNVVFGDTQMGFFALNDAEKERLISNLQEFSAKLPHEIQQKGIYTEHTP